MDQTKINEQVQQQLQVLAASINRLEKDNNTLRENLINLRNYADIVDAVAFGSMYFHTWGAEAEYELSPKKVSVTKDRLNNVLDVMNAYNEAAIAKAEKEKKNGKKSGSNIILTD